MLLFLGGLRHDASCQPDEAWVRGNDALPAK
jgi:hypothetical protein